MHPYSVKNYFFRNKKRFVSVTLSIFLGVFFVYTLSMIIASMGDSFVRSTLEPMRRLSAVYARGNTLSSVFKAELENEDSIADVLPVVSYNIPIQLNIGGFNNTPLYILSEQDIRKVMDALDMKLVEGRLPEKGKLETALHADVAKALGVKPGDRIGSGLDNIVWFPEEYKVVGIIDGRSMVSFGQLIIDDAYKYGLMALPKEGRLEEMNRYIESLETRNISASTYRLDKESLDRTLSNINLLVTVLCILVIVIVSACSGFLCYIYFSQRKHEFGLVWALGYTRQMIINRSFTEIGLMNGFGLLAGILMGTLTGVMLNLLFYSQTGQTLILISLELVARVLCIPLFSVFFSMLPVWRFLKGLDPIHTLEGVD